MRNILENAWAVTIGGGAIATLLAAVIAKFFVKDPTKDSSGSGPSQSQDQHVTINNFSHGEPYHSSLVPSSGDTRSLKNIGRVLFIDDLDLKTKIKNLRNAGWSNVSQIKNANNIDQTEIQNAEVIFVDYKGVGPKREQGLAVLTALRKRYGKSKWLILYSAHSVPVNTYDRGADSYLAKNSSVYELEQKILEGLAKLHE